MESIKSGRLSIGDTVRFPKLLTNKYGIKNVSYMILCNDIHWDSFPFVTISTEGDLFFFAEYEVI